MISRHGFTVDMATMESVALVLWLSLAHQIQGLGPSECAAGVLYVKPSRSAGTNAAVSFEDAKGDEPEPERAPSPPRRRVTRNVSPRTRRRLEREQGCIFYILFLKVFHHLEPFIT
eukprot:COSAG02_NODE_4622_length_5153_cov_9.543926_1_plen_116_part_00